MQAETCRRAKYRYRGATKGCQKENSAKGWRSIHCRVQRPLENVNESGQAVAGKVGARVPAARLKHGFYAEETKAILRASRRRWRKLLALLS